jgi:hypothetical protein
MPGYHLGRPPRNKGRRYPADPPRIEEIVAVMRSAGHGTRGARLRGLIVVLWRAGLRIHEALLLTEHDLDERRGASSSAAAKAAAAAKSAWTTGAGNTSDPGPWRDAGSRSDRCSASSPHREQARLTGLRLRPKASRSAVSSRPMRQWQACLSPDARRTEGAPTRTARTDGAA